MNSRRCAICPHLQAVHDLPPEQQDVPSSGCYSCRMCVSLSLPEFGVPERMDWTFIVNGSIPPGRARAVSESIARALYGVLGDIYVSVHCGQGEPIYIEEARDITKYGIGHPETTPETPGLTLPPGGVREALDAFTELMTTGYNPTRTVVTPWGLGNVKEPPSQVIEKAKAIFGSRYEQYPDEVEDMVKGLKTRGCTCFDEKDPQTELLVPCPIHDPPTTGDVI